MKVGEASAMQTRRWRKRNQLTQAEARSLVGELQGTQEADLQGNLAEEDRQENREDRRSREDRKSREEDRRADPRTALGRLGTTEAGRRLEGKQRQRASQAGWTRGNAQGGTTPIPRPAGMPRPPPGTRVGALSSCTTGGGPSTLRLTMVSPLKMIRPNVRFISSSSESSGTPFAVAAAVPFFFFCLTNRNSSQSARTRFMCRSKASICPVKVRLSLSVTLSR